MDVGGWTAMELPRGVQRANYKFQTILGNQISTALKAKYLTESLDRFFISVFLRHF